MKSLKRWLEKVPSLAPKGKFSLGFLNSAQSLGVVNDNLFKFSMAFLLIDAIGQHKASAILSATGAIYVLPFLLFSSAAGILADRFSKQKMLVLMKVAEITIMTLALFAFGQKSAWACYTLLFFLSTHSALFSPSKYGIISELVPKSAVSKANGLITSFTYLSIIVGTFLASFLTEITNRHFVFIAAFCLVVATLGLISALFIKPTKPQGSRKKVSLLFVREIFYTLKYTKGIRHLLPAIFGSSYFLLVGGFTQLNIIPFAIQSLHLDEVAGGYLFLSTAFGIAFGSFLAGRASKKKIELGLSCLSGLGLSLTLFCIAFLATHVVIVAILLFILGVLGGCFIVPFDTFMQLGSENERRGQTIAAANFLSFVGVLFASILLYLLNTLLGLSPATSFALIGALTLSISIALCYVLSDLFFSYFARKVFSPCIKFRPPPTDHLLSPVLILENASWSKALKVAASFPLVQFLIPKESKLWNPLFSFCDSIQHIEMSQDSPQLIESALGHERKEGALCLLIDSSLDTKLLPERKRSFLEIFARSTPSVLFARFEKDPQTSKEILLFSEN